MRANRYAILIAILFVTVSALIPHVGLVLTLLILYLGAREGLL